MGAILHNAWAEVTPNNNRFNVDGQLRIYGNKTGNKQQIKEQKSLSSYPSATSKCLDCPAGPHSSLAHHTCTFISKSTT